MSTVNQPDVRPVTPALAAEIDAQVAERTAELSELATYLATSVEVERCALAKELHDELGGLITAAKMDIAWLTAHLGASLDAAAEEKFRGIVQMLNQAMMLKRRVVENLRPSLLDHFGLAVALRSHLEEHCRLADIECVATLPEEPLDLPAATQLILFRIAQQALAGLLVRGGAKHVEVVIEAEGTGYAMLFGDDGKAPGEAGTRALFGMRHRVLGAGGSMEAESVPGRGNRIRVFVPRSRAGSG